MTILVTGVAGFVGSCISESLLQQGFEVIGIDNYDPFYSKEIKKTNLDQLFHYQNFSFSEVDLCNRSRLFTEIGGTAIDIVLHFAAKVGISESIKDPNGFVTNNVGATRNLLHWMKTSGCRKIIFASSSSVYGNKAPLPFKETDHIDHLLNPYASSKMECELLLQDYYTIYHHEVMILRFFSVYGPRQRPDLVIHRFCNLISRDKPIRVYGDGTCARDYTHARDITSGILSAVEYISSHSDCYEIVNLGCGRPVQLQTVIVQLSSLFHKEPNIQRYENNDFEMNITCADITKAQTLLGYHPKVNFKEGVEEFVDWFKQNSYARSR